MASLGQQENKLQVTTMSCRQRPCEKLQSSEETSMTKMSNKSTRNLKENLNNNLTKTLEQRALRVQQSDAVQDGSDDLDLVRSRLTMMCIDSFAGGNP